MCPACRRLPAEIGVLCEECHDELLGHAQVSPEQIAAHNVAPTSAVLVGPWGQPHRLDPRMPIGRHVDRVGLAVLEGSVSRRHALLTRMGDVWMLDDLASSNGTFVDDRMIARAVALEDGARVRFGHVSFFFVADASELIATPRTRRIGQTVRPPETTIRFTLEPRAVAFAFHEPTGGGGGVIAIDGKQVQLTIPQLELVRLLVERMVADAEIDPEARGFVHASELMKLSLDAAEPGVDHVRQLVRRVRRAMIKAEIGDLIESRHGLGYRLRVVPYG